MSKKIVTKGKVICIGDFKYIASQDIWESGN